MCLQGEDGLVDNIYITSLRLQMLAWYIGGADGLALPAMAGPHFVNTVGVVLIVCIAHVCTYIHDITILLHCSIILASLEPGYEPVLVS